MAEGRRWERAGLGADSSRWGSRRPADGAGNPGYLGRKWLPNRIDNLRLRQYDYKLITVPQFKGLEPVTAALRNCGNRLITVYSRHRNQPIREQSSQQET